MDKTWFLLLLLDSMFHHQTRVHLHHISSCMCFILSSLYFSASHCVLEDTRCEDNKEKKKGHSAGEDYEGARNNGKMRKVEKHRVSKHYNTMQILRKRKNLTTLPFAAWWSEYVNPYILTQIPDDWWPSAITRLTVHYLCPDIWSGGFANKEKGMVIHNSECQYWYKVSSNNTNPSAADREYGGRRFNLKFPLSTPLVPSDQWEVWEKPAHCQVSGGMCQEKKRKYLKKVEREGENLEVKSAF